MPSIRQVALTSTDIKDWSCLVFMDDDLLSVDLYFPLKRGVDDAGVALLRSP